MSNTTQSYTELAKQQFEKGEQFSYLGRLQEQIGSLSALKGDVTIFLNDTFGIHINLLLTDQDQEDVKNLLIDKMSKQFEKTEKEFFPPVQAAPACALTEGDIQAQNKAYHQAARTEVHFTPPTVGLAAVAARSEGSEIPQEKPTFTRAAQIYRHLADLAAEGQDTNSPETEQLFRQAKYLALAEAIDQDARTFVEQNQHRRA